MHNKLYRVFLSMIAHFKHTHTRSHYQPKTAQMQELVVFLWWGALDSLDRLKPSQQIGIKISQCQILHPAKCLSFRSEHLKTLLCCLPLCNSCIPFWKPACIFCCNASVLHSSWRQSISKAQLPISAGSLPFDYMWRALWAMQSISRVVEERTQSERCFVWRTL